MPFIVFALLYFILQLPTLSATARSVAAITGVVIFAVILLLSITGNARLLG